MNKRYIDFVPRKESARETQVIMPVAEPARTVGAASHAAAPVRPVASARPVVPAKRVDDLARVAKSKKVMARPLAMTRPAEVMGHGMVRSATSPSLKPKKATPSTSARAKVSSQAVLEDEILQKVIEKAGDLNQTMKVPQAHFVNTEKVVKRPLSKNVYQKKTVEAPKEDPQAPVTIIYKPEKDSKVGLIVTIILTIILGAAAGTVAFLLLPK